MGVGGSILTIARPREVKITAVVTRANGRIEDYGTVAYYHRSAFRRIATNALILLRRKVTK